MRYVPDKPETGPKWPEGKLTYLQVEALGEFLLPEEVQAVSNGSCTEELKSRAIEILSPRTTGRSYQEALEMKRRLTSPGWIPSGKDR